MRLLIVEDDQQFLEAELALLRPLLGDDEISVRNSRDSALKAIADEVFDYAVLDLKLPSEDEALDAAVEHGILVYERLKAVSPGTPVCFLTGFGTDDFISDRLDEARAVDIWGSGADKPMVRMLRKGRLAKLHGIIQEVKSEIQSLNDIEVISSADLDSLESRVIRISGRRQRARSILVDPLSGGLSGMRVLKMTVRDQHGARRHLCAARIGDRDEIRAEIVNYQQHIVNLPHGTYAVFTNEVSFGAGRLAGVFYELMPDLRSLLDVIRIDVSEGVKVIERLEQAESSWTQGRPQSQTTVVAIRRLLLSNKSLERVKTQLAGLGYEAFEPKTLQVHLGTQHGDLQAENVFVDANGIPVLIDFARVGEAPACLDPLTMEFAFVFHPKCRDVVGEWPTAKQAENWHDLEQYAAGCPIEAVIRAVRAWAERSADGRRALYSTAYALALRQFKFDDTDKALAAAIVKSTIRAAEGT